jgi:exonuclease III
LPCSDNSNDYKNEIGFYAGFISDVLESVEHSDVVIMGDYNFEVNLSKCGYLIFQQLIDEFHLSYCDSFIQSPNVYTYANAALLQYSCIDHFIVSPNLLQCVKSVKIIDSNLNYSDHRPIAICLGIVPIYQNLANGVDALEKKLSKVRWDKGNTT